MQEDSEDAKIALQRINAPDFKTYTTDKVREWLKKKKCLKLYEKIRHVQN